MFLQLVPLLLVPLADARGCFAPWTRIVMSDNSLKQISHVRPNDQVKSWDADRGRLGNATVLDVHAFKAADLFQIHVNGTTSAQKGELAEGTGDAAFGPLVLTAEHPVYSALQQGLVSMRPRNTYESYGLVAGQLSNQDVMAHHLGHEVAVQISAYHGQPAATPVVMTLSLDRHHWFYAEGMRVHNKGFGGHFGGGHYGGGHYGGGRHYGGGHPGGHRGVRYGGYYGGGVHGVYLGGFYGGRRRPVTASHYGGYAARGRMYESDSVHTAMAFLFIGSRRRYGTWTNYPTDACRLRPIYSDNATYASTIPIDGDYTNTSHHHADHSSSASHHHADHSSSGNAALDHLCKACIGDYASCLGCNSCSDDACIEAIKGCAKFIDEAYYECRQFNFENPDTDSGLGKVALLACGTCLFMSCIFAYIYYDSNRQKVRYELGCE